MQIVMRFWAIARPYWFGDEKRGARLLLVLSGVLLLAFTGLGVLFNNQRGALISALSSQNSDRFWRTVIIYLGVMIAYVPTLAGYNFIREKLGLYWRQWMTNQFLDQYFSNRAFYRIDSNPNIDNPDQRIAQDIKSFTQESLAFALAVISSVLQVVAFSGVLWGISKFLVVFLVIYALLGTLVTTAVFGRILVKLNFEQLKKEANFRFGLVRIRENAESIAFYQGETQEVNQVKGRFDEVFENFSRLILWQDLNLGLFTNGYEFITYIIPVAIVAPRVFAGEVEVGVVIEAQGAFITVFYSLNLIVSRFESLTSFGAGIDRLHSFADCLALSTGGEGEVVLASGGEGNGRDKREELADRERLTDREKETEPSSQFSAQGNTASDSGENPALVNGTNPVIEVLEDSRLAVEGLTLQTPNYQRTLFEDLSIELPPGEGLLVVGSSGCGKSSLLRAIAGLWESGMGKIVRPQLRDMLFLPQSPYMILGTLRDQLLYPNATGTGSVDTSNKDLQTILEQVNLPDLAQRFGGFDAEKDWSDVLSLGEQQRVAFARLLVSKPKYAILDEATSALDIGNEARLYTYLQDNDTTFISVGHRPTLVKHHQQVLELRGYRDWKLGPTEEYEIEEFAVQ